MLYFELAQINNIKKVLFNFKMRSYYGSIFMKNQIYKYGRQIFKIYT